MWERVTLRRYNSFRIKLDSVLWKEEGEEQEVSGEVSVSRVPVDAGLGDCFYKFNSDKNGTINCFIITWPYEYIPIYPATTDSLILLDIRRQSIDNPLR